MDDNLFSLQSLKLDKTVNYNINEVKEVSNRDIAIIGISAKLPMADDIQEYWENISNGIDCVVEFPRKRRKDIDDFFRFKGEDSDSIKYLHGAFLDEIDKFDYSFFKLTPKEAGLINPLQRIFLETVWKAIEDAGYGGSKLSGSNTGIYVGFISDMEGYKYKEMIHEINPGELSIAGPGNLSAIIPGRISYILNLKGPSILVDGACSSSLVAVHLACQAIRNKECELAIAGGIKTHLVPLDDDNYKIGIESSDYLTRTFDESSDGSGVGEGSVAFVLKSYAKAKRDGDNIYGVIKGSAVNQDGTSIGLTAPNPMAHADVIVKAWENAGVNPETVAYIEAHGTATKLGDSVEIQGLQNAFRRYTEKKQFCAISSAKSNMGHLYDCAGAAGMLKAVLALKNKKIPPSIHFSNPNRKIEFEESPIYVNDKLREWKSMGFPRRCGVSSFGISGSNCHIILQEADDTDFNNRAEYDTPDIFTLSAKSKEALYELIRQFNVYVKINGGIKLNDICCTINTGRWHHNHRLAFIAKGWEDFKNKLSKICGLDINSDTESWLYYGEHKVIAESNDKIMRDTEITGNQKEELNSRANKSVENFISSGRKDEWMMHDICQGYIQGADINWDVFYKKVNFKRVSLPTYPFDRKRCWIDIPDENNAQAIHREMNLYYGTSWQVEELGSIEPSSSEDGLVLVLSDKRGIGKSLACEYRSAGRAVVLIEIGKQSKKINSDGYVVTGSMEDFKAVLDEIDIKSLRQVIHLFTLDVEDEITSFDYLKASQEVGVYSLFNFVKAICSYQLENVVGIIAVSSFVNSITGREARLIPENATLFGLGKVIEKENSFLKCRCVDIDDSLDYRDLINEMNFATHSYTVAYRDKKRFIECFESLDTERLPFEDMKLKEEGIYIITGGTGGIGLEAAKYLAGAGKINLALFGRTSLPQRDKWESILAEGNNLKLCRQIKGIHDIEANGSSVFLHSVDITKQDSLDNILCELRSDFGKINGIIHGAGTGSYKFIEKKGMDEFESVLAPKVYGTWILDKLTQQDNIDFMILFSSVATVFSAAGQGDYTAANSYLDSYSFYRNKRGKRTQVIDWTTWKEVGMSVDMGINFDTIFKTMLTGQAIERFDHVLHRQVPRVLIGEINYEGDGLYLLEKSAVNLSENIAAQINAFKSKKRKIPAIRNNSDYEGIKLEGRVESDYTRTEMKIAGLCQEMMGFSEINIHDSFFELGADSIMLKKIHSQLEILYPGKVKIADIFEHSTIYKLSQYIINQNEENLKPIEKKNIKGEVENLFDRIESGNLSIEEALSNLNEM